MVAFYHAGDDEPIEKTAVMNCLLDGHRYAIVMKPTQENFAHLPIALNSWYLNDELNFTMECFNGVLTTAKQLIDQLKELEQL